MNSIELKEQVISKIQITEDQDVLEFILGMLEHDIHPKEIYELNEQQNQRIDVAQGQIERGETYTELEADKITNDWLEQ